jgi:hypothetical protein
MIRAPFRGVRALAFAAAALSLAAAAYAESNESKPDYQRRFEKTVAMKPGQRFEIDHSQGAVRISAQKTSEAKITAEIVVDASDDAEGKKFGEAIEITVEELPGAVSVRTRYPEKNWSFHGRGHVSYSVDYTIVIPESAPLTVRDRFGDVDVAGMRAASSISNANGKVSMRDCRGGQRIDSSFGPIDVARVGGGDTDVTGSNGSVSAMDVDGSLSVKNRFGPVTAQRVKGAVGITSSNGEIFVEEAGGNSRITGSFGRIAVRGVNGTLEIQNQNGEVALAKVTGTVRVRNSFGGVEVTDTGAPDVENSNGKIRVRDVHGPAMLRTSFAEVDAANIPGDATVSNNNGPVTLLNVNGAVDVRGSFAPIRVTKTQKGAKVVAENASVTLADVGGAAYVKTSFGLVDASRIQGELTVENSNGAVKASAIQGGASVRTSFASVSLDGIGGRIDVDNQNGAVDVRGLGAAPGKCFPVALRSTFAPIRIYLPEGEGFQVTARTSFGKVNSEIPMTMSGSMSPDNVTGKIGNGGCELTLANSNGNIDLLKAAGR